MSNLPANQPNDSTHLSQERVEHREWIGGRCMTLLSHYWRDDDPVELTAAIGKDWADVLEGLPQEFINRACIQFLREETRKPKPSDIYRRALAMMPKPTRVPDPEPERGERCSPEAAAKILAEAGLGDKFATKRTGGQS